MKINSTQETVASLLSSTSSRDKSGSSFQASLDAAKENLAQSKQAASTQSSPMRDAMATARKEIEEYLRKGPIAHMREQILKDLGLSEEDVARMPPEQREAVEKTIAVKMKEILLAGTGMDTKGIQAQLMGLPLALTTSLSNKASEAL